MTKEEKLGKGTNTKSVNDKKIIINAIRKKLSETEMPKEIMLEKWARVTDTKKFFETHLSVIENQTSERVIEPASDRLKKALLIVGIDIKEIVKSIKNK